MADCADVSDCVSVSLQFVAVSLNPSSFLSRKIFFSQCCLDSTRDEAKLHRTSFESGSGSLSLNFALEKCCLKNIVKTVCVTNKCARQKQVLTKS